MASRSWFDNITDEERKAVVELIDCQINWMCRVHNQLQNRDDHFKTMCSEDMLRHLCSSFQHFLTVRPFKKFTAKECYFYAAHTWKTESRKLHEIEAFPSSPKLEDPWTVERKRSGQFLGLRSKDYWNRKTGRVRIICSVVQAAKMNSKFGHGVLKPVISKMIVDFAHVLGVPAGVGELTKQDIDRLYPTPILDNMATASISIENHKTEVPVETTKKVCKPFTPFGIDEILGKSKPTRPRDASLSSGSSTRSAMPEAQQLAPLTVQKNPRKRPNINYSNQTASKENILSINGPGIGLQSPFYGPGFDLQSPVYGFPSIQQFQAFYNQISPATGFSLMSISGQTQQMAAGLLHPNYNNFYR